MLDTVTGLNLLGPLFIQNQMDLQLQGKLALVTGSTAGIGFAVAQGLAKTDPWKSKTRMSEPR